MDKYIELYKNAGLSDDELDYYMDDAKIALSLGYDNPIAYYNNNETIHAIQRYTLPQWIDVAISGLDKILSLLDPVSIISKAFDKTMDEAIKIYNDNRYALLTTDGDFESVTVREWIEASEGRAISDEEYNQWKLVYDIYIIRLYPYQETDGKRDKMKLRLHLNTGTAFTAPLDVEADYGEDLIGILDRYYLEHGDLPVPMYTMNDLMVIYGDQTQELELALECLVPINGGEYYIDGISHVEELEVCDEISN